jgi:hypothetical protein
LDDQRQALASERDRRASGRPSAPGLDVETTIAVADEGGETVLQRLVDEPIDRGL